MTRAFVTISVAELQLGIITTINRMTFMPIHKMIFDRKY